MDKIKIDSSSKFLSSFSKLNCSINIDVVKEKIDVEVEILDKDFLAEIKKLDDKLVGKFKKEIEYVFSSKLDEEDLVEISIGILKFKSIKSSLVFSNYKIEVQENIRIGLDALSLTKIDKDIKKRYLETLKFFNVVKDVEYYLEEFDLELPDIEDLEIKKNSSVLNVNKNILMGREIAEKSMNIKKVLDSSLGTKIVVEGDLYNLKIIKRPKVTIVTFNIYCIEESINCKFFAREEVKLKNEMRVRVRAIKEHDKYTNDASYVVKDVTQIILEERQEIQEERVELNVHSKMSELGSIVELDALLDRAKSYGYKELAITDSGVVYAFPDMYSKSVKRGIKPIFGMEGNLVDDRCIISNEENFKDNNFIVFDLETTGVNPHKNKIIEIGAVRVKGNDIVDKFHSFVDPEIDIPSEITEITGIRDDMVKGAKKIEEILPDFIKFISDSTIVGHNVEFDMGFLRINAEKIGHKVENAYVDNLDLARSILSDKRKHRLNDLAKHFNFELKHHRALDDAEATAKIFLKLKEGINLKDVTRSVKLTFPNNILIYAKNLEGLKELYDVVSHSHLNDFRRVPKISKKYLSTKKNLLYGASFVRGELVTAYASGRYLEDISKMIDFYDFIEISPLSVSNLLENQFEQEDIQEMVKILIELSNKKLVIATSNVRYLDVSDHKFMAPLDHSMKRKIRNRKEYFRKTDELIEEFNFLGDLANTIVKDNSITFAKQIEDVRPIPEGFYPPQMDEAEERVRSITYSKARKIYGDKLPKIVEDRIELELKAIIQNGFSVLYLISHELVKKSLEDGYLVGSRGSVGSSLVAWLMDITEVNALAPHYICMKCNKTEFINSNGSGVDLPAKSCCGQEMIREGHTIPFEIFMGYKGEKIPDIDLNFSGEYQLKIHNYVEEIFGKENVFRAGTISTLAKKNAFGYSRKYFDEQNIEASRAHIEVYGYKCENVRKTTGQHPGGMIIIPKDMNVSNFTPIQRPANDQSTSILTTHFDYHVMDEQLVKLDLLGHDDPTTLKILSEVTGVDPITIPLNDEKTLNIFSSIDSLGIKSQDLGTDIGTFGIPEFGTPFARRMLRDTRPTTFADIVRISGLSHGIDVWSNNAENLIKEGIAKLSEVISVRDDIMNYMLISGIPKDISFKIMEFVRKGLPTKKRDQWLEYTNIMKKHNIPQWYIDSCSKITYMFPKGHAVAYVLMAVRIAYFKVHYPQAFYSAYLTRKADFFDLEIHIKDNVPTLKERINQFYSKSSLDVREKNELYVLEILLEMKLRKIDVLPTDLYRSSASKFIIDGDNILAPFIVLKGLGESRAEKIVSERVKKFKSLEDLRNRTKVSKTICDKVKELNLFDLQEMNQGQLF